VERVHALTRHVLAGLQGWLARPDTANSQLMIVTSHAVSVSAYDAVPDLAHAAAWALIHTAFALHYAHTYYRAPAGVPGSAPLQFPGAGDPGYVDFLYFAFVIGSTAQTADVGITSARMRRLAMMHGVIAFFFNTTLLALAVNAAAATT